MDPLHTLTPPKRSYNPDTSSLAKTAVQNSPAFISSIKKHSLYGTDDSIIIDPGSRFWKIGFSGESRPRSVFDPVDLLPSDPLYGELKRDGIWGNGWVGCCEGLRVWRVDNGFVENEGEGEGEGEKGETKERSESMIRLIRQRLILILRSVYTHHLKTPSKSRKVLIISSPSLPRPIRRLFREVLRDVYLVKEISFLPSSITPLLAQGRTTGLVLDVGWTGGEIMPVFQTRLLRPYMISTSIGGRTLVDLFDRGLRGGWGEDSGNGERGGDGREGSQEREERERGEEGEGYGREWLEAGIRGTVFFPPYASTLTSNSESTTSTSNSTTSTTATTKPKPYQVKPYHLPHPSGTGRIIVSPEIRVKTGEGVLFGVERLGRGGAGDGTGPDEGEEGLVALVARCLTRLPMDLRRTMARNIVIVGGISSIPGFLNRFEDELVGLIDLHSDREGKGADAETREAGTGTGTGSKRDDTTGTGTGTGTGSKRDQRIDRGKRAHERPFACLAGLRGDIRVVNAPRYLSGDEGGNVDDPEPPGDGGVGWNGALASWIGGSIAGALQLTGEDE